MASIEYVVNGSGTLGTFLEKMGLSVDQLNEDLDQLSRQVATPAVDLDDKDAVLKMARIAQQLDKLKEKVADPKVELDQPAYEKMRLQILRLDAQLTRLDHKRVTVDVDVDVNRGGLRGLLAQIRGAATGEQGVFGGTGGLLSSPVGIGAIAGGGLIAGGLVPGVAGLGLGGLAGLGAIGGGLFAAGQGNKIIAADQANIKKITAALKTAVGGQRKELHQSLTEANKQFTKDMTFFAPFMAFQGAIKNLTKTIIAPLRPIMEPLTGIINEFGKGLTALGPQFTALFKASLPFIKAFADVMLRSGKILLPAFTQALQEMVKSGALKIMTDGLVVLTRGLATFIRNLGPGMRASAIIFKTATEWVGRLLGFLGDLFTTIAKVLNYRWSNLWHDLTASAKAFWHAVVDSFHAFWHTLASSFDAFRHDAASVWDTIWRNTVTRAQHGISDIIGWVRTLPGRAISALWGLGHRLAAFAHDAFTDMWNAAKNVAGSIWHWLTSWVHDLPAWLRHLLHISSPSGVFYDIGKNMMLGLFHGIKDHANQAKAAWGGALGGLSSVALGGDEAVNQALARRMFPWGASQWPAFVSLEMREAGFNRFARNPSSGAYGIPQALPPTKMPFAAQAAGGSHAGPQLAWMFNYIAQRYGNPAAAWAHEVSAGWYDRGGWLPTGLSLALNTTGRPERVGGGPGSTYNITINAPAGNGREIGRQIVTYIKQFEQGSGSGWRK